MLELTVRNTSGDTEIVRSTALHKFWSLDRQAWLSAEDLRPGEHLDGHAGPVMLVAVQRLPGVHHVYNLTVEHEHVYRVGTLGVLVHNNGCSAKPIDASRPRHGTPEHDATAFNEARRMDADPAYSDVRFNQGLVDTNGQPVPGFRPDAQGTRTLPNGTKVRDVTEVRSPSQRPAQMQQKEAQMRNALGSQAGDVRTAEIELGAKRQE